MRKLASLPLLLIVVTALCLPVQAAEKTKLSVAMWINSGEDYQAMEAILDTYQALNPNIEIELTYQGWGGYHDKMLTMVASGLAPDVMVLSRVYMPSFAEAGALQPMDGFLAKETRFNPKTDIAELVSGTYQGKVWGIPIWGGPAVMLYNGDIFAQSGLLTPDRYEQSGTWNWDTYVNLGKKITADTNGDGVIDRFMAGELSTWQPIWQARILQNGGRVVTADGKRAAIDQPEAAQALEYWLSLAYEHHIAPQAGEPSSGFEVQGLAMVHTWSTTAPSVFGLKLQGTFEMGMATQPAGPRGYYHVAGGCPITVTSASKHPTEAYQFASWFAILSDQWKVVGLPASIRTLRREFLGYLGQLFANPQTILKVYENPTHPEAGIGPHFSRLEAAWNPILTEAVNGTISAKDAAANMARAINSVLDAK